MILRYGNYSHALSEVRVSYQKTPERTSRGYVKGIRHVVTISGDLRSSTGSTSDLTTAFNALTAAYSQDGNDLIWYEANGSTITSVVLRSRDFVGGVQVSQMPSLPELVGADYVTRLPYTIVLEGFQPTVSAALVEFSERVEIIGTGGPRRVIIETANTAPVVQTVAQQTPVFATQSGRAIGRGAEPTIPPPIWPSLLLEPDRSYGFDSPTTIRGALDEFSVTWSYRFQSPSFINARPSIGIA